MNASRLLTGDVAPLGRKVGATDFARGVPQTSHVSVTGLKWLELLLPIFYRSIGTDNTPNPFLQILMKLPGPAYPQAGIPFGRGRSGQASITGGNC